MKVTTEELERCEILMTIEVEPAQEQKILKKAAKKIAREVPVPGFRKGKAPYGTIVRRFGLEAVQQEALEDSGEKIIQDALVQSEVNPSAQISFDGIDWDPLTIKIKVPGPPKVELSDYRELRLDATEVEISDDDIAESLKAMQEQNATWAPVERATQEKDLVSLSVVEKHEDEVIAEHDSVEYELILPEPAEEEAETEAENSDDDEGEAETVEPPFQPDLTTPLLGVNAGEEKTFTITYPEAYEDDRYAGKDITFNVTVNSIKEKELDPLDDEFAQSVSDFETLDELKKDIEKNLLESRQLEANRTLGQELLDKIVEDAKHIEWPAALEEEMINDEIARFSQQFEQAGLSLDNYLQIQKKDEDEFKEEIRENVLSGLKRSIVLSEVTKLEKLEISNSEVLERAKSIADSFGGDDQIWQYLLSSEMQQGRLANELLTEKILLRLGAIAKGEAPEPGEETEEEVAAAAEADEPQAEAEASEESEAVVNEEEATAETEASSSDEEPAGDEATEEVAEEPSEEEAAKEEAAKTEDAKNA